MDRAVAAHAGVKSVELAVVRDGACRTVAATAPEDVGEKCDADENGPMRTGTPDVEAPSRADPVYDITQALHDAHGTLIGAVGMDIAPTGLTRASALALAEGVRHELEASIPSKQKVFGPAPRAQSPGKILAQKLVEAAQAKHADVDEIGILATTSSGCRGIASTDKTDIGEKCEADDSRPLRTGKPSVEKEGEGFDVAVLLHDAVGKTIGVLVVGFKRAAGQTEASARQHALQIEAEMAKQIKSKADLLAGSQ